MQTALAPGLKVGWYGDDFTGAADTLATAAQAGLRSLLFLGLPTPQRLDQAGPLDALGIAGAARAMSPEQMQTELLPVAALFARLAVPVLHYKVCSTFDSAPHVGSIGAAIDLLGRSVANRFIPIVGGQPSLGRYCVFGHLFARAGSDGDIHRIDRHPTMSRHPVTPMRESDLRLHLAAQGLDPVGLLTSLAYDEPPAALDARLDALQAGGARAVLLDAARAEHLAPIGRLIWQRAQAQRLLAVGASSVVQALAAHWQTQGLVPLATAQAGQALAPAQGPVLVLAGSLSPVSRRQVAAASSYTRVTLDAARMVADEPGYAAALARQVQQLLHQGRHVLAVTSEARSDADTPGTPALNSTSLAQACGRWLADVLQAAPVRRLGIAGGDTSSHAVQALDAWGMSFLQAISPGVALCRLHSEQARLDGMEIVLKGGQMGSSELFEDLCHGR
jgi:uncharacterized protein YgbK (DUF1537 family)